MVIPSFHEVQFPADVSVGAVGGPEFKTTILTLGSGDEKRNIEWSLTRGQWNIGTGLRLRSEFEVFQQFFYARFGRAYGFRFKDWSDYQVIAESWTRSSSATDPINLSVTNGNKSFQLYKTYSSGGYTFYRPILKPVTAPVEGASTLTVNGVAKTFGGTTSGHWDFDSTTGIITLGDALADSDVVEIVYMEFDVPVRFDIDKLDMNMAAYEAGEWINIPIVELKQAR